MPTRRTPAKPRTPKPVSTPEGVTTPASGGRQVAPKTPGSATRMARLEEKSELQDLNKRLEFYILKQRERDASAGSIQRTLGENKEFYEKEITKMKSLHESQIAIFRKQRDAKDSEIEKISTENKRQANMIKQYTSQLAADRSRLEDLEDRVSTTSSELSAARARIVVAEEDAQKATHKVKGFEAQIKSLEANLKDAQDDLASSSENLAAAQSTAKNIKEDFAALSVKYNQEVVKAGELEAELSKTRASVEDELRSIFGKQLKQILVERQKQYEEDKAAGLNDLKNIYEEKMADLAAKNDALNNEMQAALQSAAEAAGSSVAPTTDVSEQIIKTWETRVESLQNQLANQRSAAEDQMTAVVLKNSKEVAALRAEIDVLSSSAGSSSAQAAKLAKAEEEVAFSKTERASLRSEIADQKKKLSAASGQASKIKALQTQVTFLTDQCAKLKEEKNTCESEYISLMDVKVALDMEIRAYHLLLENEEHRLAPPEPEPEPAAVVVEEDSKHTEDAAPASSLKRRRPAATTPAPKAKRSRAGTAKKSTKKSKKAVQDDDDDDDTAEPAKPTFIISNMDKKWIQITNNLKENVSLDGWSLKVQSSKQSFFFPDAAPVKAGKNVTVHFGSGGRKPKNAIVWDEENIFSDEDKLFLVSPEGVGHSSVAFSE